MQKYIELTKPDKKDLESDWYHYCSRKQVPFIKITARARFADVHWDYAPYNSAKVDDLLVVQAEHIKAQAKKIFDTYSHAKSSHHITENVIFFYDLELSNARQAAKDLYDTISSVFSTKVAQQATTSFLKKINKIQNGLPIPEDKIIAAALYHTSLEHCYSVTHLISEQLHASAAALIRPAREAYIRGCWVNHSSELHTIQKIWDEGVSFPSIKKMHTTLQNTLKHKHNSLELFNKIYTAEALDHEILNCLTHNGLQQILGRLPGFCGPINLAQGKQKKIESCFSKHDILVFLEFILSIAFAAGYEIINTSSSERKTNKIAMLVSDYIKTLKKIKSEVITAEMQLFIE